MSESPPDYMEWVLGWRQFKFTANGYAMALFAGDYVWSPGENKAECINVPYFGAEKVILGEGSVVHDECHCGFNAYFDKEYIGADESCALIRGRGERFSIHPEGFRSEYAEILCFVGPPGVLERACQIYGVPRFETREAAKEWALKEGLGDFFPEDRRPSLQGGDPLLLGQEVLYLKSGEKAAFTTTMTFAPKPAPAFPYVETEMEGPIEAELSRLYGIVVTVLTLGVIFGLVAGMGGML